MPTEVYAADRTLGPVDRKRTTQTATGSSRSFEQLLAEAEQVADAVDLSPEAAHTAAQSSIGRGLDSHWLAGASTLLKGLAIPRSRPGLARAPRSRTELAPAPAHRTIARQ